MLLIYDDSFGVKKGRNKRRRGQLRINLQLITTLNFQIKQRSFPTLNV